ncbi:acyltransferase [Paeniglutamicibacter sp. Y32M11]|uniref:acyltransferase family protein n=1 Tax=Paeniglutamicibacter sp. Y32M11 TaxID=2853258 RepID=UPI001C52EF2A|nr:acyltransferase [Paeniglutamicibacter sp. Y32M11]QXQ09621.1 acyltransferase [Paeniglutamicibacter sp. Y32M11]
MGFLRVFLALAVISAHTSEVLGFPLVSGRTAVECFFVISGFYMAMVLETKYLRVASKPWITFMKSRLVRLFPVYLLTIAASILLILLGGNIFLGHSVFPIRDMFEYPLTTWLPIVISNITIVTQDWSLFAAINPEGSLHFTSDFRSAEAPAYQYFLVPQAWTVGLEITFYLLAPLLARRSTRTLIGLLFGSIALRVICGMFFGLRADPWSYRFFPFELSIFIAGMLAYRFRSYIPAGTPRFLPLGTVLLAFLAMPFLKAVPPVYLLATLAFPLVFALFVPAIFESTKKSAVDRWIGELSYPVYLVHILVISAFASVGLHLDGATAIVASLAAGIIVVLAFDRPLEARRQRGLERTFRQAGIVGQESGVRPTSPIR